MTRAEMQIERIITENCGMDYSVYDDAFIKQSVHNRMTELSLGCLEDYLVILQENQDEKSVLSKSLSNVYSEFFRNPLVFSILDQIVFPMLLRRAEKDNRNEIRIWSAGCAGGQEPYSLAMLLAGYLIFENKQFRIKIFATDRSENEIKNALTGKYSQSYISKVPYEKVSNYFLRSGDDVQVSDKIKRMVDFSVYDLLDTAYNTPPESIYGGFDLVMCCNVLLYYKKNVQIDILKKLTKSMNSYSFLVTGESEAALVEKYAGLSKITDYAPVYLRGRS